MGAYRHTGILVLPLLIEFYWSSWPGCLRRDLSCSKYLEQFHNSWSGEIYIDKNKTVINSKCWRHQYKAFKLNRCYNVLFPHPHPYIVCIWHTWINKMTLKHMYTLQMVSWRPFTAVSWIQRCLLQYNTFDLINTQAKTCHVKPVFLICLQ